MTPAARCEKEIADLKNLARSGHPDVGGIMLGLHDQRTELGFIERERYARFLGSKKITVRAGGFDPADLNSKLYDFQRDTTRWGLRKGKCAFFQDCGLGKTAQQLVWAWEVSQRFGNVIVFAPLCVSEQTVREGRKFDIPVHLCRQQSDVRSGISITNYEMMEHFDPSQFVGVVLDESSILKGDGPMRKAITEFAARIPYRLACTATPAPNDHMELGNHAEFLGIMSKSEMLATFFVHDGGDTSKWRLKGHAEAAFWRWVASWAVMIRKPSDLGYDDGGFELPPIEYHQHTVAAEWSADYLFPVEAQTLLERNGARRDSLDARVKLCAELVNGSRESWICWCNLNDESVALARSISGAIEVTGSDSRDYKTMAAEWFAGHKCICEEPMFRSKLQECHSLKNAANTCGITTKRTVENSAERQYNKPSTTSRETLLTQPAQNLGKEREKRLESGNSQIQKSDLTKECGPTESLPKTTEVCSEGSMGGAPYAEDPTLETKEKSNSTLTTATKPELSGGSYAGIVITDSANSRIILPSSKRHYCICGHQSGRRVMVSKPSVFGYGMNFQQCRNAAFVGLSDSWEMVYQATRRIWRFGQKQTVHTHFITGELEGAVVRNIERKERQATEMAESMLGHMREINTAEIHGTVRETETYKATKKLETPQWL